MGTQNMNRRQMLKFLGLSGTAILTRSALAVLFDAVVHGQFQKALAQSTGIQPRRYLMILLGGAPPRWHMDQFMTPYSSTGFFPGPGITTKYTADTSGIYTGAQYSTVLAKGIQAPWMWQFNVPAASGGVRPMADLLTNMLNIRGIAIGSNDHNNATSTAHNPLGAATSLLALSAEKSSAPIPHVSTYRDQNHIFKSQKPITATYLPTSGNRLISLMEPFTRKTTAAFNDKRNTLATSLKAASTALEDYAATIHPGARALAASQDGAETLLKGALGDMTTVWNSLLSKYQSLVTRSLDMTQIMPGLNDKPIGVAVASRDLSYRLDSKQIDNPDLRSLYTTTTAAGGLAEQFAVAEFVLINNISSSVSISQSGLSGLALNGGTESLSADEHFTGMMPSLLGLTLWNKAHAACMLELIDKLKAANIFQNTVIDVRGEFGRVGSTALDGTDHSPNSGNATFYTGLVTAPTILGNIANGTATKGSHGVGVGIDALSGQVIDMGNIASTIAMMLGVPSAVTARGPLVSVSGGVLTPVIEKAKQV